VPLPSRIVASRAVSAQTRELLTAGHVSHRTGRVPCPRFRPKRDRLALRYVLVPSVCQTVVCRAGFVFAGEFVAAGHGCAAVLLLFLASASSLPLLNLI
jgi:hypothetical protein